MPMATRSRSRSSNTGSASSNRSGGWTLTIHRSVGADGTLDADASGPSACCTSIAACGPVAVIRRRRDRASGAGTHRTRVHAARRRHDSRRADRRDLGRVHRGRHAGRQRVSRCSIRDGHGARAVRRHRRQLVVPAPTRPAARRRAGRCRYEVRSDDGTWSAGRSGSPRLPSRRRRRTAPAATSIPVTAPRRPSFRRRALSSRPPRRVSTLPPRRHRHRDDRRRRSRGRVDDDRTRTVLIVVRSPPQSDRRCSSSSDPDALHEPSAPQRLAASTPLDDSSPGGALHRRRPPPRHGGRAGVFGVLASVGVMAFLASRAHRPRQRGAVAVRLAGGAGCLTLLGGVRNWRA